MNGQDEPVLIVAPTGRDAQLAATMLREQGVAAEVCNSLRQTYPADRDVRAACGASAPTAATTTSPTPGGAE